MLRMEVRSTQLLARLSSFQLNLRKLVDRVLGFRLWVQLLSPHTIRALDTLSRDT